jgi:hypothetical protein
MDGGSRTVRAVGRPAAALAGRVFGFLRVVAKLPLTGRDGKPYWLCYCHGCGEFTCCSSGALLSHGKSTCGCFRYCRDEALLSQFRRMGRVWKGRRSQRRRWSHKRKLVPGKERA